MSSSPHTLIPPTSGVFYIKYYASVILKRKISANIIIVSEKSCNFAEEIVKTYGAQNEAYNVERGRKTPKAVYLQRVARVEAIRSAQNETFT